MIVEEDAYLEGVNMKIHKLNTAYKNTRPDDHSAESMNT